MGLWLTHDDDANKLLDSDAFALVTGMCLDQQYSYGVCVHGAEKDRRPHGRVRHTQDR